MQLVTRAELGWPATPAADMPTSLGVDVHWIGGPYNTPSHSHCADEVQAIRQEHLNDPVQRWVDIAYNFVVCQHGVVFEARGLHKESGANGNQTVNHARYAVCAIQGTNESAGDVLKNGLRDAIEYMQANGAGGEIHGHRDDFNTDCPGDELYAWVQAGAPRPGGAPTPQPAPAPSPSQSCPAFPGRVMYLTDPHMNGTDVETFQGELVARTWDLGNSGPNGDGVDGDLGKLTAAVVLAFQRQCIAEGFDIGGGGPSGKGDDGKVGKRTWAAIWLKPRTKA